MRARSKIILDRVIGRPLAFFLNLIVWPIGKIVRRDHGDSADKVKVIAIAKLLGMGSILRATPLIRALRQKYPAAKYIFITTLKNKPIVERLRSLDACFFIRDYSIFTLFIDVLTLIPKLWSQRIDLYFDLEVYSAFSTILATLSLARNRYGFYRESTQFRSGLNTHLAYFNDQRHISEIYLQLAKACGIESKDYTIEKITLLEKDKRQVEEWFKSNKFPENTPYVVINPNASDLVLERRWPKEYFVLLINALAINWHYPIFIVGSPEESFYSSSLWDGLSEEAKSTTFNLAGKISLGAVIALISKATLMITNDSGLYHVAVSAGTPVISLWGPGNPEHYADRNANNNFIFYSKDIYCSPCIYKVYFPPCRGENICMKYISVREIYKKCCEVLGIVSSADTSAIDYLYEREDRPALDITMKVPKGPILPKNVLG